MAKRRSRRRYGEIQTLTLGNIGSITKRSVNVGAAGVGIALGIAGVAFGKWAVDKVREKLAENPAGFQLPELVAKAAPLLGLAAIGAGSYYGLKKFGKGAAYASSAAIGAGLVGLGILGWRAVARKWPQFDDVVSLRLNEYGVVVDDPAFGVFVPDGRRRPQLSAYADPNMQMGEVDEETFAAP